ncbi:MAG: ABC transporter permease [Granulosicoccus sp.]|nr:ABC transporter permease [Granulosicoccus sp.]
MITTIARRELGMLFRSPLTWIVAALMQVVFAWLFLLTLEDYLLLQPKLALQDHAPGITAFMSFRYIAPVSSLLLLVCPLLTMRSFSDEYRLQTYPLLSSSPVSLTALVLGKFTGVWIFAIGLAILIVIMPLSLAPVSGIDSRTLLLALAGLLALSASSTAIGIFYSSITKHNFTAAIATLMTIAFFWLAGKGQYEPAIVAELMSALAMSTHLGNFFQGIVHSRDIFWFVIVTVLFLTLTVIRLDSQRYSPAH